MIHIEAFTFNAFSENTYVLWDDSQTCIIVDPGCYDQDEKEALKEFIEGKGLKVAFVVNTHCHIDHVLGNDWCKFTFKAPLLIPPKELPMFNAVQTYAPAYGFHAYRSAEIDGFLPESGEFKFGESALQMLLVPGHSVGHLAFYAANEGFCVSGDVLFSGSVGRTDLPGGNFDTLMHSIRTQLYALPDNTVVYCGHGPATKIGIEKKSNPFCKA
jgi:glyoxylase-like metal-dependent hydrolase (beta-lactamase superfamily II)